MRVFPKLTLAVLLMGAGCSSPQFRYVPTGPDLAVDRSSGEAAFPVPATGSSGNVRITSLGIVDLKPKNDGEQVPALHLRVALSNQGSEEWIFHIPDQTVSFPNARAPASPIYANSDSRVQADVTIPGKNLRTIDLFYALPSGRREAQDLPEFDFHWKVDQAGKSTERSISFARQTLPEYVSLDTAYSYPYVYGPTVGLGWGQWWWGPSVGPYVNYRH